MLNKRLFKKPNIKLEGAAEDTAVQQPESADVLVHCAACDVSMPADLLRKQDYVCPHCGALQTISARDRLHWLCDEGSFTELNKDLQPVDRLQFPQYAKKLEKAQQQSGENEGRHHRLCKDRRYPRRCVLYGCYVHHGFDGRRGGGENHPAV